jgi:hypothetical protein
MIPRYNISISILDFFACFGDTDLDAKNNCGNSAMVYGNVDILKVTSAT